MYLSVAIGTHQDTLLCFFDQSFQASRSVLTKPEVFVFWSCMVKLQSTYEPIITALGTLATESLNKFNLVLSSRLSN